MISSAERALRAAIKEVPLRATRAILEEAGLETTRPFTATQYAALQASRRYIGYCEFEPQKLLVPFMGGLLVSLDKLNRPYAYLEQTIKQYTKGKSTDTDYIAAQLCAPAHTLEMTVSKSPKQPEQVVLFAGPDTPLTAIYEANIQYVERQYPDSALGSDRNFTMITRIHKAFGDTALLPLTDADCITLANALEASSPFSPLDGQETI